MQTLLGSLIMDKILSLVLDSQGSLVIDLKSSSLFVKINTMNAPLVDKSNQI